jgi:hypothetical protein
MSIVSEMKRGEGFIGKVEITRGEIGKSGKD